MFERGRERVCVRVSLCVCVCACTCVCARERESKMERKRPYVCVRVRVRVCAHVCLLSWLPLFHVCTYADTVIQHISSTCFYVVEAEDAD